MKIDPQSELQKITSSLKAILQREKISKVVVAVSGGIDSAVSLTIFTQILGKENVYPILLPYNNQVVTDSKAIVAFNQIPKENVTQINISQPVDCFAQLIKLTSDQLRLGNIMARVRMVLVYDHAKKLNALVGGTENKSEKYLGYFTRFGDEASDIEPIVHLFKTQVRQLAQYLEIPAEIITKAPSAQLWEGQTDEKELGFSYSQADKVLAKIEEIGWQVELPTNWLEVYQKQVQVPELDNQVVKSVLLRVDQVSFKHRVPYRI